MDVSKIGEALVSLGKALMADTPTKKEVELVADATHEAPEQFEELYDDFIAGTSAEYVEQAKDALDKVQERVRGAYLHRGERKPSHQLCCGWDVSDQIQRQ